MRPRPQLPQQPQQPPTTREYSRINQTRYGLCLAFIMGFAIWYAVLTELVYQKLADGLHEEIRALVNREIVQLIKELNQIHDLIAEALTGGQKGEIEGGVTQGRMYILAMIAGALVAAGLLRILASNNLIEG
ncbi:hypothetical protein SLA2020_380350 [Shorea laevis]